MKRIMKGLIGLCSIFLLACSNTNDTSTEQVGAPQTDVALTNEEAEVGERLIGEKVIKTVTLNYETLLFDETLDHIMETIQSHDAYIEFSYESTNNYSGSVGPEARNYRRIEYTLRVPTDALYDFLGDLDGMEAVKISEQIGSQDVTQQYTDLETRIGVLNQKEERLQTLLSEAVTIEEILQIENQLSETIAERETLQSQVDNFDSLIAYTEVHLTVDERQRISEQPGDGIPFWERFKEAVVDSMFAFYYWIQNFVIWLIFLLPYLVVAGLIYLLYRFILRRYKETSMGQKREKERSQVQMKRKRRTKIVPQNQEEKKETKEKE